MVKIRLKRIGKKREPYYRIVVTDARARRDGRVIEEIGKYYPKANPSQMTVVSERVQYWLSIGAQPSQATRKILEVLGEWAKFRGETVESRYETQAAKPSAEVLIQQVLDQAEQVKAEARKRAVAAAKAAKAEAKAEVKDAEGTANAEVQTAEGTVSAEVKDAEGTANTEVQAEVQTAEGTASAEAEVISTPEVETS